MARDRRWKNVRFYFETFDFPVEAEVVEYDAPAAGKPGRVTCHCRAGQKGAIDRLDVHHAWLLEDLPGGQMRILTQETQKGKPTRNLATATPNPMINDHQNWLNGLVAATRKEKTQ